MTLTASTDNRRNKHVHKGSGVASYCDRADTKEGNCESNPTHT